MLFSEIVNERYDENIQCGGGYQAAEYHDGQGRLYFVARTVARDGERYERKRRGECCHQNGIQAVG